jgi:hypothetical protein
VELFLEELDGVEAAGARALNFFLADNSPAFTVAAVDRMPLFGNGRWGPITIRTSHPDLVVGARNLAEAYYQETRMPARVVVPS